MDDEKIYYGCSMKMAYIPKFFLWMQSKIDVKKKFKKITILEIGLQNNKNRFHFYFDFYDW